MHNFLMRIYLMHKNDEIPIKLDKLTYIFIKGPGFILTHKSNNNYCENFPGRWNKSFVI